jgi:glucose/arabinose dehydrogenase
MSPSSWSALRLRALGALALAACGGSGKSAVTPTPPGPGDVAVTTTTLAGAFDTIWELAWGPDNQIWVTERSGVISRVNPATGAITRLGTLPVNEVGEGGLMGMAFHPDYTSGSPFLYVSHTYSAGSSVRNRVARVRVENGALGAVTPILEDVPGSSVHNGSRIVVGPDRLLYVSFGDASNTALPQNPASLAGKILRLTLDGLAAPGNPTGGRMYTLGHRNPQGLVFARGTLYATEHGPGDNDELNRIEAGRNYGWPDVRGRCDGDAGQNELSFCAANNVVEPLAQWTPTIAPAGLDFYDHARIPQWRGSLLFTTLKGSALYRAPLSADGRSVGAIEVLYSGQFGRLRDVLVAPDGAVYLGTSNRDGRGNPQSQDDRIIRLAPQ